MKNSDRKTSMAKIAEINMTEGSIPKKMACFVIPIMLTSVLQMLFNAADMMVAGRFAGSHALAAVGACSSLINLLVTLFTGISSACNIIAATFYGAGKKKEISAVLHTAMVVAAIGGLFMLCAGMLLAPTGLRIMGTPEDILSSAILYIRIYFVSMPAMLVYNYASAILRALGDSRRPLYFLIISGGMNVILNLLLIIVFHLGVAGVAAATTISQYAAAVMIIYYMTRINSEYRLQISQLKISGPQLRELMRIGIPAGIQGTMFSISNVVIQSTVNSFGSTIIAACSAVANVEGIVYVVLSAVSQAAMSFTAQNAGAGLYERVKKVVLTGFAVTAGIGLFMSVLFRLGSTEVLQLYTSDAAVLEAGSYRIAVVCIFYLFCGTMDVFAGSIRGLGYSLLPTIVSLLGACGLRILWIFAVFKNYPTLHNLYLAYPVSWIVTTIAHGLCFLLIWKRIKQKFIKHV